MISLVCDNCERKLEVPDDMAGKKVKCPACGDVNSVPGALVVAPSALARKTDRAVAAGLPGADAPEERVLLVRKAMFRARPVTFSLLFILLMGGVVGAVYFGFVAPTSAYMWMSIVAAAVGFVFLLVWKIKTFDETLEITNKRVIDKQGLFSKHTTEVRHDDVRNIQVSQSFRERIFNVGRVGISSSAQDDMEINARDIPAPGRVRDTVDLYRTL